MFNSTNYTALDLFKLSSSDILITKTLTKIIL